MKNRNKNYTFKDDFFTLLKLFVLGVVIGSIIILLNIK